MSNERIDGGGPAFPVSLHGWGDNGASGMTLRDYFAAKSLQGLANGSMTATVTKIGEKSLTQLRTPIDAADLARWSYELADAMLSARESPWLHAETSKAEAHP